MKARDNMLNLTARSEGVYVSQQNPRSRSRSGSRWSKKGVEAARSKRWNMIASKAKEAYAAAVAERE